MVHLQQVRTDRLGDGGGMSGASQLLHERFGAPLYCRQRLCC